MLEAQKDISITIDKIMKNYEREQLIMNRKDIQDDTKKELIIINNMEKDILLDELNKKRLDYERRFINE